MIPVRPTTVIALDREFDVPAAHHVAEALERTEPGGAITLDFHRVTQFHDFGIALLAQAIGKFQRVDVRLSGLRTHQVRVLRYFGVDADAFRTAVAEDSEESRR